MAVGQVGVTAGQACRAGPETDPRAHTSAAV